MTNFPKSSIVTGVGQWQYKSGQLTV